MSKTVESLERRDISGPSSPKNLNEDPSPDLFSKLSVLLWLGVSISATVFSYQLGIKQGMEAVEAESPKQWLPYFSDFAPMNPVPKEEILQEEIAPSAAAASPQTAQPHAAAAVKKKGFTIQVVTYKSQKLANAEVELLKKKRHDAFVVPSGIYYQVCIDVFKDRKSAMKKLIQLRVNGYNKTYPGAFVKAIG